MRSQPQALVFDFDGVLANTEPLYWKAWAALLASHDVSLSWEDYCRFGRGVKDVHMLERLPQLASSPSILSSVKQQMGDPMMMIRRWCLQQSPIGTSTVNMLNSLKAIRMGLVTSSDRADVEPMLHAAGIFRCFHSFVFSDDVHHHKPDPEPYLLIRKKLGIKTGIAFEDSDVGLESAATAGLTPVRVEDPCKLPEIVQAILSSF